MIPVWIIIIPLIGGLAAWMAGRWYPNAPRWIALAALAVDALLLVPLLILGVVMLNFVPPF
ncbi:MAG: hypothetical protein NTU83_06745, partial [Candidatus Hydrogenedentes bacterium]|nr:hypothetical protein [Candidatus Hydrogenedentota bacterium]